jgi:hypothetical protein
VLGGTGEAGALLAAAGIDPGERGERLGLDAYLALARAWVPSTPAADAG